MNPYPETSYMIWGNMARDERDSNARPEINNLPSSIDGYDTIIVCYPIWWHTAPMIIGTFLENYDLEGKDIYPVSQSQSMNRSQFNTSVEFIMACSGRARVHDGLFARSSNTRAIDNYLTGNGLI